MNKKKLLAALKKNPKIRLIVIQPKPKAAEIEKILEGRKQ
jgi:hypothetical protein